jgi:hypothetical protein
MAKSTGNTRFAAAVRLAEPGGRLALLEPDSKRSMRNVDIRTNNQPEDTASEA